MPPSTITTSGTQTPLVASALSYPQNADPTTYLPYSIPQILTTSGTWRHPKPGVPISISYIVLGGGGGGGTGSNLAGAGGGGSGRISIYTTATVTKDLTVTIGAGGALNTTGSGTVGGTTSFNSLSAAGGAGGLSTGGTIGGAGGSGGFGGGGGGGRNDDAGAGGAGLDFIGGGGGAGGATGGVGGAPGASLLGQLPTRGSVGANYLTAWGSGYPNGQQDYSSGFTVYENNGGYGGFPGAMFPWMYTFGSGGRARVFISSLLATDGIQGAVFIWYNRP